MAEWNSIHQNCNFENPMRLLLLCEKTVAVAPGFMAGWQPGKRNVAKFRDF